MRKLLAMLRSSLLHFFVLGALIFATYAVVNDTPTSAPVDDITLTPAEANGLVQRFRATWNRPPTAQELDGLMRNWVLEEANVREARALNLDRGDAVIRQRLNLKMQFLAEAGGAATMPEEAVLQTYLDENAELFVQPPVIAFEQVMLSLGEDPTDSLARLNAGARPSTLGGPSLLPTSIPMTSAPLIDRTFGNGFHTSLLAVPIDRWAGPVNSGYGQHLVRVTERSNARVPSLSEIRERVAKEWRASEMQKVREAFDEALLARYSINLPSATEVLQQ